MYVLSRESLCFYVIAILSICEITAFAFDNFIVFLCISTLFIFNKDHKYMFVKKLLGVSVLIIYFKKLVLWD